MNYLWGELRQLSVSLCAKKPAIECTSIPSQELPGKCEATPRIFIFLAIFKVIAIRINVSSEQVRLKHN